MEFLEHSVLEHINHIKPVSQDRVIETFKTMLQTLQRFHEAGFIHQNLTEKHFRFHQD